MDHTMIELITPKSLEVENSTLTPFYGKFFCEPLERGYGITLGNSLRRILLSSIRGASIVGVRIDGVLHEFSTIPNVKEDVTEIILNLKEVQLKMLGEGTKVIKIKAEGEKELKAGDIITNGSVEILNPEFHIATLGEGAKFNAELVVKKGVGYVSAERNKSPDFSVNTIPIDAIFSPIKKVNYYVTNARVGQLTNYDKLTIEIWTNGAITPQEALSVSAQILRKQMEVFITTEIVEEKVSKKEVEEELLQQTFNENIYKTIEELDLPQRAQNCLHAAGLKYVGDIVQKTETELLKTKNLGRKSLKEIKEVLSEMGLSLGMRVVGFDPAKKPF